MEEFLLHTILVAEELNIVNEKNVRTAVFFMEAYHIVLIDALDKVVSEFLACYVNDIIIRILLLYLVSNSMHKVSLTQSGRTIDKQRIVILARLLCNSGTCSVSEFV